MTLPKRKNQNGLSPGSCQLISPTVVAIHAQSSNLDRAKTLSTTDYHHGHRTP